jgi:Uma2 family endonuclease
MSALLKPIDYMAVLPTDRSYISPEEYLTIERASDEKHEYFEGEVVTMNGASMSHVRIVANLVRRIGNFLENGFCEVISNDMRLSTPDSNAYMYPDVSIFCGKPRLEDDRFDTLKNPSVIFEVLSPSTEKNDRGRKFYFYKQIPSLKEYIMIDASRYWVDICRRQTDSSWERESIIDPAGFLDISTIKFRLPLEEVYRNVVFSEK